MFSQKIELFNFIEYNKKVLFVVWTLVLSKCFYLNGETIKVDGGWTAV